MNSNFSEITPVSKKRLRYTKPLITMVIIEIEGNIATSSSFIQTGGSTAAPKIEEWIEEEGTSFDLEF